MIVSLLTYASTYSGTSRAISPLGNTGFVFVLESNAHGRYSSDYYTMSPIPMLERPTVKSCL